MIGGAILQVAAGGSVTQQHSVSSAIASGSGTLQIRRGRDLYDPTAHRRSLGDATHAIMINNGALAVTGAATAATFNGKLTNTGVITIGAGDVLTLATAPVLSAGESTAAAGWFLVWQRNDAQHIKRNSWLPSH